MLLILKFLLACVLLYWAVALGRFIIGMAAAFLMFLAACIGFVIARFFRKEQQ